MTDLETFVNVPDGWPGDYVLEYEGKNLPLRGILNGDRVVVLEQATAEPGALVLTTDPEGRASLVPYQPGVTVRGLVTGVLRKLVAS